MFASDTQSPTTSEVNPWYYRGIEVPQALDETMTVDELGLDITDGRERVAYLEEFDGISRDGEIVRL